MTAPLHRRLEQAVLALPESYPGPGGAVAVVREGEVLIRHAWGYANSERAIPFSPRTLFRMCSITKQFTCAAVLDAVGEPEALDREVQRRLPALSGPAPTARQLCHNQSGLRDYWALAMLHGAAPEGAFGDEEADRLIGATRSLQFVPGTRYAYCNQNFRLLSDALEARLGRSFAEILRTRVFERAGMQDAFLAADTRAMPDGAEGYEGSPSAGFRPAVNRILWTGDAGLGASLEDMIAWERFIDAERDQEAGLYQRLCAPVFFSDGSPAAYGFGLARGEEHGATITGHGGALRGWRSHRLYCRAHRLSVVVMFNHLSAAHEAASELLGAALGTPRTAGEATAPAPDWQGAYLDPETGLSARVESAGPGAVVLRFGHAADRLAVQADGGARGAGVALRPVEGGLWMDRPKENLRVLLRSAAGNAGRDFAGRYRCEELDAEIRVADAGGALYGAFFGFLGQGRMEQLEPIGADLWALPCPRALDHTPPGDWTLRLVRDGGAEVAGLEVGCWLARKLAYRRVSRA